MEVFARDDLPVVFALGGAEVRAKDVGGMTVWFYRLPAGADARPLLQGLPGDTCNCPHWAFVTTGKLRIHTSSGARDVEAGQGFYVEPGHAPEALADTEMVEVSPIVEARALREHLAQVAKELHADIQ